MDFLNFKMIDQVVSLDKENKSIICTTKLPESSSIFDAHFPGFPILPGVFMIETIAQAAGFLFVGLEGIKRMPILFGVENTRFRQIVQPTAQLMVRVQLSHYGSGYIICAGEIDHQDANIAKVEVRLKLIDIPTKETEQLVHHHCIAVQLPM